MKPRAARSLRWLARRLHRSSFRKLVEHTNAESR